MPEAVTDLSKIKTPTTSLSSTSSTSENNTFIGLARTDRQLEIQREVRATRTDKAELRKDGSLLIGELPDILLIIPAKDLTSDINSDQFKQDLQKHAGKKPFIVIELNQQSSLPTDSIIWPLLEFRKTCGESSTLILATRDSGLRDRITLMTKNRFCTIVDTGQDAIQYIDLKLFMEKRKADCPLPQKNTGA